jgi:predicted SAM-dependent methyltransferase
MKLDIGCGDKCAKGFTGIDIRPGADIEHDLEVFPWPIDDGECSEARASHIVEHIRPQKQLAFMDECWRVLKTGGTLSVSTPMGGSERWHQDPTHCASWNDQTPGYFDVESVYRSVYSPKPWKIKSLSTDVIGDLHVVFVKVSVQ